MTQVHVLIEAYLADVRRALRARGMATADTVDELYDHLAEITDAAVARGQDPTAACTAALTRLGTPTRLVARLAAATETPMPWWLVVLAALDGLAIAFIDASPNWDDTGITVGLMVLSAAFWALFARRHVWAIALAIGAWIPAAAIIKSGDVKFLVILLFPLAGAYAGAGFRRLIRPASRA